MLAVSSAGFYTQGCVMNLDQRPSNDECFDYHRDYVAKVGDGNILTTLQAQLDDAALFLEGLDESLASVVHPPYEWTIRQVIEHCVDAERVFGYRVLRFAAGDETDLPGWDENHYARAGYGPHATLAGLANEFEQLRSANLCLLSRLSEVAWNRAGTADGRRVSVRTLAWLMAGHWIHHQEILERRLAGG